MCYIMVTIKYIILHLADASVAGREQGKYCIYICVCMCVHLLSSSIFLNNYLHELFIVACIIFLAAQGNINNFVFVCFFFF